MMQGVVLKISTPERIVFQDSVAFVSLMGVGGSFGVLPGHAPLVTQLAIAPLYFDKDGLRQSVAVMGGLCRVSSHHVTVLTDAAELAEEIDELRAAEKRRELETVLQGPADEAKVSDVEIQSRLQKAILRLRLADGIKRQKSGQV
jgi:F-type H+-transporting ATPase subunit epsilon